MHFDSIPAAIADIRKGRMVIVTDDADRENEGDLVMAASKVTNAAVNFMAKHGRGLICTPITEERARQLGLQRMVAHNREMHKTDFTVSVDAAREITTGISAKDRALTIKVLAASVDGADAKTLREAMDKLKDKLKSAAIVLGSVSDGKVALIAGVTADLTGKVKAGELVNYVAQQVGGKGGGRPDMAQAGGTEPAKLGAALESVKPWVEQRL